MSVIGERKVQTSEALRGVIRSEQVISKDVNAQSFKELAVYVSEVMDIGDFDIFNVNTEVYWLEMQQNDGTQTEGLVMVGVNDVAIVGKRDGAEFTRSELSLFNHLILGDRRARLGIDDQKGWLKKEKPTPTQVLGRWSGQIVDDQENTTNVTLIQVVDMKMVFQIGELQDGITTAMENGGDLSNKERKRLQKLAKQIEKKADEYGYQYRGPIDLALEVARDNPAGVTAQAIVKSWKR